MKELEIRKNIIVLAFLRLSITHGQTGRDFQHSANLGQRTIKDIEAKRQLRILAWETGNPVENGSRRGQWIVSDQSCL